MTAHTHTHTSCLHSLWLSAHSPSLLDFQLTELLSVCDAVSGFQTRRLASLQKLRGDDYWPNHRKKRTHTALHFMSKEVLIHFPSQNQRERARTRAVESITERGLWVPTAQRWERLPLNHTTGSLYSFKISTSSGNSCRWRNEKETDTMVVQKVRCLAFHLQTYHHQIYWESVIKLTKHSLASIPQFELWSGSCGIATRLFNEHNLQKEGTVPSLWTDLQ